MKITTVGNYPVTIGWLIALLGLVLAIIFMAIGRLDFVVGGLFAAAFLARLI